MMRRPTMMAMMKVSGIGVEGKGQKGEGGRAGEGRRGDGVVVLVCGGGGIYGFEEEKERK